MLKYQETSPGWEITKIRMLQYTSARIFANRSVVT